MSDNLVTLRDAATQLGLAPSTLYVYKRRHDDFPEPVHVTGGVILYELADVAAWYKDREPAA